MYLPLPFVRNRLPNRAVPAAASSMVARFARSAAFAALILALVPDSLMAQDLPGHFQFGERRVFANGNACTFLSDVKIQGGFVLVAPLGRKCTNDVDEFSADEGYMFPLNGKDNHSRECLMAKGEDPLMTCSDGEKSSVRGVTSLEPLRIEGTISHASTWDGTRLALDLNDFETRFTMAGGSGKRAQKLQKSYHLVFSFPDGQCVLESIKRSRLANGRNQSIVSIQGQGCKVMR